jgi:hypothetical protein
MNDNIHEKLSISTPQFKSISKSKLQSNEQSNEQSEEQSEQELHEDSFKSEFENESEQSDQSDPDTKESETNQDKKDTDENDQEQNKDNETKTTDSTDTTQQSTPIESKIVSKNPVRATNDPMFDDIKLVEKNTKSNKHQKLIKPIIKKINSKIKLTKPVKLQTVVNKDEIIPVMIPHDHHQ